MIAALASPWAATVEGLVAALALRAAGRPALPAAVAAPLTLGAGKALKTLVDRRRPGLARFTRKGMQSFPSTHVAAPVAVLASVACLAPRTKKWRTALALGGVATIVVARERLSAGAHWASDVAAGAALGAVIGTVLGRVGRPERSPRHVPSGLGIGAMHRGVAPGTTGREP
jgi:membrane-associated phospholipid phosphatase